MSSDYEKICKDNIRRRGEEFDDIGRLISEQLYSDRSHFIYELLQNAEDALARRFNRHPGGTFRCAVQFRLFSDRLEFRHFGVHFDEDDVRGVSDVLKGTKSEDVYQIGKFGIGFKSVYALTASPEIHSGDEHFVIKRYIRPEAKEPERSIPIAPDETVFVFPFDHEDLSATKAYSLILEKLRRLGPRVLLFLRRIDEIAWSVESGVEEGHYLKETEQIEITGDARRITVVGQKNGAEDEENWVVFERPVEVPDNNGLVPVEIGYRIGTNDTDGEECVVAIDRSPLVVYFPTQKDTRFGFLIQGPYHTTTSRDNILSDDDWNQELIDETADLVVESLQHLKTMGMLSVSALSALPIEFIEIVEKFSYLHHRDGHYYAEFQGVFAKVRAALLNKDLLPANDGTFVSARNAKLARSAALVDILNHERLGTLFQSNCEIKWLSDEITQDRTPGLRAYLMEELDIEEVDPEVFARKLSEHFLVNQDDKWLIEFYKFLRKQEALWRPPSSQFETGGLLRKKPILRLQDGSHVNPFRNDGSPNAYLAIGEDTETTLPFVKVELTRNKVAMDFLQHLGIPVLDIVAEVVEEILPKYEEGAVTVEPGDNRRDLWKIDQAFNTDSQKNKERLGKKLRETPFILVECPSTRNPAYRKPDEIYFATEELRTYFEGNDSVAWVWTDHPQSALFKDLGVREKVRIQRRKRDYEGYVSIRQYHGDHERGLDGFDPDIRVDGLERAISTPTVERSRYIWNKIAVPNSDCIRGIVEESTRRTFEGSNKSERKSEHLGKLMCNTKWLPDSRGNLHRPCELTLDDLPVSFVRDERLADQLGMKKDAVAKLAKEVGISTQDIELLRQDPEGFRQWKAERKSKESRPEFPERVSDNPERREEQIGNQVKEATEKEYVNRERATRVSRGEIEPDIYLRNQYTNQHDQMICQICEKKMPFKKRDGEYYFEAVEALSTAYFPKEHPAQFLALCPVCAARYKEFVKRDEGILRNLYHAIKNSEKLEVPLKLGELERNLRFVETHWIDIKTILREFSTSDDTVVDRSDSWSEQDQRDFTKASLQHAVTRFPEDEHLV